MKKLVSLAKRVRNPFTLVCTYLFVMMTTQFAHAQKNPFDSGALLPDSQKDKSLYDNITWIFAWGVRIVVIAAMLFGIGRIIFNLYAAFQNARDRDDWSGFVVTLIWSIVVIVASVLIAGIAWVWADNVGELSNP